MDVVEADDERAPAAALEQVARSARCVRWRSAPAGAASPSEGSTAASPAASASPSRVTRRSPSSATWPSKASVDRRVGQVGLELRRARREHDAAFGTGREMGQQARFADARLALEREHAAAALAGRRARRRSPPVRGRAPTRCT